MKHLNQEQFLKAANWALLHERQNENVGINVRRMKIDETSNVALFNGSKGLLFAGYEHPEQERLKGLIVEEKDGKAVRILAACFPKFYNLGEPAEKKSHMKFLSRAGVSVTFLTKEDGVNIRPYWNAATGEVEFATRGTLTGLPLDADGAEDEDGNLDYGTLARSIAEASYPVLLDPFFVQKYSTVFEMIHPESKILTDYGSRKDLVLLAAFNLEESAREISRSELKKFAQEFNLKVVSTWFDELPNTQFDDHLPKLQQLWDETDSEGTVALFVRDKDGEPLYRLKIKNSYYLQMLRLSRFCTLKSLRMLIEENNFHTWAEVREYLYKTPSMNEELEMAYKVHFDTYQNWKAKLAAVKAVLLVQYAGLPTFEEQRDFAEYVLKTDYHAFFFEFKKFEKKNGDISGFWEHESQQPRKVIDPNTQEETILQPKLLRLLGKIYPLGDEEEEEAE